MSNNGKCTIDGCEKTAWQRGMCSMHYKRWERARQLTTEVSPLCTQFLRTMARMARDGRL